MTVLIEMVVDRSVSGSEFLQGLEVPKFRHRSLSSAERLMGVFSSIVEPTPAFLPL